MNSRRYVLSPSGGRSLPLHIESIGINADQETIERPAGYPYFHWLQTIGGEGGMTFEGRTVRLAAGSGVLLRPHVPHRYEAAAGRWQTLYLTFGGSLATEIAASLHLQDADDYNWEPDTPFASLLPDMIETIGRSDDPFGIDASTLVYRFLLSLLKFGRLNRNAAVARNLERLRPLTDWLEIRHPHPGLGLGDMAAFLGVSKSGLNLLFRETYGVTPYSYLLHLRLRKAKELLANRPELPVRQAAAEVGFRDASHFVASFRKSFGMPPEQYRKLN